MEPHQAPHGPNRPSQLLGMAGLQRHPVHVSFPLGMPQAHAGWAPTKDCPEQGEWI